MSNEKPVRVAGVHKHPKLEHEAEGVASGMVVGALLGVAAGPAGMVAGAVIGGVAGAVTAAGLDMADQRQAARTKELDVELGIDGGDVGAPNLKHPPSTRGTVSAASAGAAGSAGEFPAEGPMQSPDVD